MSNGAELCYLIACEQPGLFKAFAPVAGKSFSFIASMSHMWATSELLAINQVSLTSQLTKSVN